MSSENTPSLSQPADGSPTCKEKPSLWQHCSRGLSVKKRPFALLLITAALLMPTMVALAQDSEAAANDAEGSTVSAFKMFFIADDIFGQIIIILLLLMSVLSFSLTIMYAMNSRRSVILPEDLQEEAQELIDNKQYGELKELVEEDESYLGALLRGAVHESPNGYAAMERGIEEAGDVEISRMLRPTEYLNVLGNISPMIGLFGTVYGMIRAFQTLVASGGSPDPAQLAAGISTALVTTLWGLVVAIPALTAYSIVRNRIDALTGEGFVIVEDLMRPFRPVKRRPSNSTSGSIGGSSVAGERPRATPQPD